MHTYYNGIHLLVSDYRTVCTGLVLNDSKIIIIIIMTIVYARYYNAVKNKKKQNNNRIFNIIICSLVE